MADLNATIQALATGFAQDVLRALRGASLADLGESSITRTRTVSTRRRSRPGWPKCKTCGTNAHPRGKGYCWEHALAAGVVKGSGGPGKAKTRRAKRPAATQRPAKARTGTKRTAAKPARRKSPKKKAAKKKPAGKKKAAAKKASKPRAASKSGRPEQGALISAAILSQSLASPPGS